MKGSSITGHNHLACTLFILKAWAESRSIILTHLNLQVCITITAPQMLSTVGFKMFT